MPEADREGGMGWDGAVLGISLGPFPWEMGEKPAGSPLLESWEGGRQSHACPDPLVDTDFEAGMSDPAGIQFLVHPTQWIITRSAPKHCWFLTAPCLPGLIPSIAPFPEGFHSMGFSKSTSVLAV